MLHGSHSCSPNTIIFTVVHDTPPNVCRMYLAESYILTLLKHIRWQSGLPFIAFVAVKDIPAREEFTFDYSPNDSMAYHTKGKLKKKPKGSTTCHCDSERCRGYITSTKWFSSLDFWSFIISQLFCEFHFYNQDVWRYVFEPSINTNTVKAIQCHDIDIFDWILEDTAYPKTVGGQVETRENLGNEDLIHSSGMWELYNEIVKELEITMEVASWTRLKSDWYIQRNDVLGGSRQ